MCAWQFEMLNFISFRNGWSLLQKVTWTYDVSNQMHAVCLVARHPKMLTQLASMRRTEPLRLPAYFCDAGDVFTVKHVRILLILDCHKQAEWSRLNTSMKCRATYHGRSELLSGWLSIHHCLCCGATTPSLAARQWMVFTIDVYTYLFFTRHLILLHESLPNTPCGLLGLYRHLTLLPILIGVNICMPCMY